MLAATGAVLRIDLKLCARGGTLDGHDSAAGDRWQVRNPMISR
jgi:hypothetical protein